MKISISAAGAAAKSDAILKQIDRLEVRIDKLLDDKDKLLSEYREAIKAEGKKTLTTSNSGRITVIDVEMRAIGTGRDKVYEVAKLKKTSLRFFRSHKGIHLRDKDGKLAKLSENDLKTLPKKFDSLPKVGDRFTTLRNVVLRAAKIH